MGWEILIPMLINVGVRSWTVIHAAMQDSGLDDAQIALLKPKWDALVNDVARAAGVPPPRGSL